MWLLLLTEKKVNLLHVYCNTLLWHVSLAYIHRILCHGPQNDVGSTEYIHRLDILGHPDLTQGYIHRWDTLEKAQDILTLGPCILHIGDIPGCPETSQDILDLGLLDLISWDWISWDRTSWTWEPGYIQWWDIPGCLGKEPRHLGPRTLGLHPTVGHPQNVLGTSWTWNSGTSHTLVYPRMSRTSWTLGPAPRYLYPTLVHYRMSPEHLGPGTLGPYRPHVLLEHTQHLGSGTLQTTSNDGTSQRVLGKPRPHIGPAI